MQPAMGKRNGKVWGDETWGVDPAKRRCTVRNFVWIVCPSKRMLFFRFQALVFKNTIDGSENPEKKNMSRFCMDFSILPKSGFEFVKK